MENGCVDMKCCGDCDFYRWIEDLYGDGSYVEYEYCDDDENRPCSAKKPACDCFAPFGVRRKRREMLDALL